jgi:sugar-phosphatase
MRSFDAAIFDMDGLLIDSEPFWRIAEMEVFSEMGITLSDEECGLTAGLRTRLVVEHWLERRPWDVELHPVADVTVRINQRVVELVRDGGAPKEGVQHALDFMRARGLRLALASSSNMPVIEAALARIGIAEAFEVVHSADFEKHSKPAPDVYLGAARRLGVEPGRCIALEDSYPGTDAAKAAGMVCIRFPERGGPVSDADLELDSLLQLDDGVWQTLTTIPNGHHRP